MKNVALGLFVVVAFLCTACNKTAKQVEEKPGISFTFDDGSVRDMPNYSNKEWNQMILGHLETHELKAVFFVTGSRLMNEKGYHILNTWNDAGHRIANHTFTHPGFHSDKTTLEIFKRELEQNDSLIRQYSGFYPSFRFPYLKEGNTLEKRDGFRAFLKEKDYTIGHVTIDASDWYVNKRLIDRWKEDSTASVDDFRKFYIEHLYDRAMFYDSLATQLTGRKINHTLLLHHNLTSALFLGDLIQFFKKKGWKVMDADKAFEDEVFKKQPGNLPAGESLIWAMAKEKGTYESILRYPAEDSRYEKEKMDDLGL